MYVVEKIHADSERRVYERVNTCTEVSNVGGERIEVYDVERCAVYTEVYRGVGFFHTCREVYDVEGREVYDVDRIIM